MADRQSREIDCNPPQWPALVLLMSSAGEGFMSSGPSSPQCQPRPLRLGKATCWLDGWGSASRAASSDHVVGAPVSTLHNPACSPGAWSLWFGPWRLAKVRQRQYPDNPSRSRQDILPARSESEHRPSRLKEHHHRKTWLRHIRCRFEDQFQSSTARRRRLR